MTERPPSPTELASEDPEVRRLAVRALSRAPEVSPGLVLTALGDVDWRVRKEAVDAARALAGPRELLSGLVDALLPGDNVGMRNAAVEAIGAQGGAALDVLRARLPGLDADGRKLAVEAASLTGDPAALGLLGELLGDADPNVRQSVLEGIGRVGPADAVRASALLERALVGAQGMDALAALQGLARLGVRVRWDLLQPLAADPLLRDTVLEVAAQSGHPEVVAPLVGDLGEARASRRSGAIHRLGRLVSFEAGRAAVVQALAASGGAVAERLVAVAVDPGEDVELRRAALVVLGGLQSREAAEALIEALTEPRLAGEAERALAQLGDVALVVLAERACSGPDAARTLALDQIAERVVGAPPDGVGAAVLAAAEGSAPPVVAAALRALASLGDARGLSLAARTLAGTHEGSLKLAAEHALVAIASLDPGAARALCAGVRPEDPGAAVPALLARVLPPPLFGSAEEDAAFLAVAASNESPAVRRAALRALATRGGTFAVEALAFALQDESSDVRRTAFRELGRLRDDEGRRAALEVLLDAAQSISDEELMAEALRALAETGAPRAVAALGAALRDGSPACAVVAAEGLGCVGTPAAVDALLRALGHPDAEVVKAALVALPDDSPDPRLAPHLGACLDHPAWDVRRTAAELVAARRDPGTRALLVQRLGVEREPLVREELLRALSALDGAPQRRSLAPFAGGGG